jgi:hypothetical protein
MGFGEVRVRRQDRIAVGEGGLVIVRQAAQASQLDQRSD